MSERLLQIYESDLDACIDAVALLATVPMEAGAHSDSLALIPETLRKVKDDYGPHTIVQIIPADE